MLFNHFPVTMHTQADWSYVKSLYIMCNILGFLPPHKFGADVTPVTLCYKLYTLCLIFLTIALFVDSWYGRENYVYDTMDVTVAITDKIANVALSLVNVVLRFFFVFWNSKILKTFINKTYEISKKTEFKCFTPKCFNLQFIIFNVYMTFIILFDGYVWNSTQGFKVFRFYIGRSVMYYVSNVVVFFMFHSALIIKHLFTSLNFSLKTTLKNIFKVKNPEHVLTPTKIKTITTSCADLKRLRVYYNQICDLVDNFNKLYGLGILSVIIFAISYILNLTDLLLVYAVRKSKMQGFSYGNDLIILSVLWMMTLLVSHITKIKKNTFL